MASRTNRTIAKRLGSAKQIIENTLNTAAIREAVAPFGYSEAKMGTLRALHEAAQAAVPNRATGTGSQREATRKAHTLEDAARAAHGNLAAVARAVLSDTPERLTTLGLDRPTPAAAPDFLLAANALFAGIEKDGAIKALLAEASYDDKKLQSERARVAAFEQATLAQKASIGGARRATALQNAALKALDAAVARYVKIARVALAGRPDLLATLGIATARGGGRPRKAAASNAAAS